MCPLFKSTATPYIRCLIQWARLTFGFDTCRFDSPDAYLGYRASHTSWIQSVDLVNPVTFRRCSKEQGSYTQLPCSPESLLEPLEKYFLFGGLGLSTDLIIHRTLFTGGLGTDFLQILKARFIFVLMSHLPHLKGSSLVAV